MSKVLQSACLCMFMYVCPVIYLKYHMSTFHEIFCIYMIHVAVARSSSNDSEVRYVLLALWMTSCLCNGANGPKSSMALRFELWRHRSWSLPFPTASCLLWIKLVESESGVGKASYSIVVEKLTWIRNCEQPSKIHGQLKMLLKWSVRSQVRAF